MKLFIETSRSLENRLCVARYSECLDKLQRAIDNVLSASVRSDVDAQGNYIVTFDAEDANFDRAYEHLIRVEEETRKQFRKIQFYTPGIYLTSATTKTDASGN